MSEAIASKAERLAAYNANIAAAEKDPSLSPETGKPLSKMNAARFGAGFLVFGVLWMSGLGIVSAVLLPMHYKTIPGVNAETNVHFDGFVKFRLCGLANKVASLGGIIKFGRLDCFRAFNIFLAFFHVKKILLCGCSEIILPQL